jgi:hypothetical protein
VVVTGWVVVVVGLAAQFTVSDLDNTALFVRLFGQDTPRLDPCAMLNVPELPAPKAPVTDIRIPVTKADTAATAASFPFIRSLPLADSQVVRA